MHGAKYAITSVDGIDYHPKGVNIHHFLELQLFTLHLVIDGVEVFLATFNFSWNTRIV